MDLSRAMAQIVLWSFAGGALGLLVGFALVALGVLENPFWGVSAGILVGAIGSQAWRGATRGS